MLRNHIKNSMILIQFIFAFLAIYLLMTETVNMVKSLTADIGYEQKNLLGVQVSKLWAIADEDQFNSNYAKLSLALEEIQALPFVKKAGITWAYPMAPYSSSGRMFQRAYETPESVEALGVEIIAGRNFNDEDAFTTDNAVFLINERAYNFFQEKYKTEIIGENFYRLTALDDTTKVTQTGKVVGVFKEYRLRGRYSLYGNDYVSMEINRFKNKDYFKDNYAALSRSQGMNIRTDGSVSTSKASFAVTKILERIFNDRSVYVYSIEQIGNNNAKGPQQKFFTLLFICAILVFIISIGIIAITKENLTKRIREIGIRMALGSTERQITMAFVSELIILSLISSLIASISVFLLTEYEILKFTLRWQEFVFSFLTISLISLLSILKPVLKASKMRPNIALHYE